VSSAATRVAADLMGRQTISVTLPSRFPHQFGFSTSAVFTSASRTFSIYDPVPLVLRTANVSSLPLKLCGFVTPCFSAHALLMMLKLVSCWSSTGFGPVVVISTINSPIFRTPAIPVVSTLKPELDACARSIEPRPRR
jgi:hypothetical protein